MTKRDQILDRIIRVVNNNEPDSEIYLYGSRARGDAKKLSSLVAKDSVENNVLSTPEAKMFLAQLPKEAQCSMYLNIGRLGRSITKLLPSPMFATLIPENMPGIFSYIRIKDNMVEGAYFIPTEELKAYVNLASFAMSMGGF